MKLLGECQVSLLRTGGSDPGPPGSLLYPPRATGLLLQPAYCEVTVTVDEVPTFPAAS
jgi:hypothetical protein